MAVKGFSSLPSVKAVQEKMAKKGKLTGPTAMMAKYIEELEAYLATKPTDTKAWLEAKVEKAVETARSLQRKKAERLFSIIVGKSWFTEFASLDENAISVEVDGTKYECTAKLKEEKVKI
jgi:hypothetical protein